jgi:hypothetical protein
MRHVSTALFERSARNGGPQVCEENIPNLPLRALTRSGDIDSRIGRCCNIPSLTHFERICPRTLGAADALHSQFFTFLFCKSWMAPVPTFGEYEV